MDERKKFIEIFSGLERAYGQTKSRSKNQSGKLETDSWIVKEQLTEQKWHDHLDGKEPSLGIIPIKDDNTTTWGAIDIDSYDGFDHKKLIKQLNDNKLPLVVCKSKSGGAHVFLFVKEPAKAVDMQMKLTEIAAWLGYGETEIFPKQIELNPKGTGNFLNLPYNHPEYPTRYALDDEGNALDNLGMFITHYESKVVSNLNMVAIKKKERDSDDWKGAPPCLVTLASRGFAQGSRNESLFQVGIYLRQRFQESELEDKLDYYNLKYFQPPLRSKEVQTLLKQVSDRKNYFYRCKLPIFAEVCEEMKCRNTKHGIGKGATSSISSLKKFVSDEPVFEVTHNGKVLVIDGDTLANHSRYKAACIKQINESPQPIRADAWADKVQSLFDDPGYEQIIMPGELSSNGQFLSYLQIFIQNNGGAKDRQDMLQGMVYEQDKHYMFKPQALRDFLKTKRFTKLTDVGQFKVFSDFDGKAEKIRIEDKPHHIWKVPTTIVEAEYKLKDNEFKEEEPY
jgi:hypothetical protein